MTTGGLFLGLLHLSNLTFQSVDATMQQVFYALILGLALSFIRILTNGLWVGILLHSLIDFQPTIATGGSAATNWGSLLLIFLPLFVISLLWLWFADRLLLKRRVRHRFHKKAPGRKTNRKRKMIHFRSGSML